MGLEPNQISTTITVMWDGKYWMTLFERRDSDGYSVAKATISVGEPQGYQVEKFLKNLRRCRLQFTAPGPEPVTTQTIVVEKKLKYEKTHVAEVQLKNMHGDAKTLLQKQKNQNRIARKEKENAENRESEEIKRQLLVDKKVRKHKGR
jgi:Protein of unknown function (DUF2992)